MVNGCVHRGISRLQAEQLLLVAAQNGSFLVRDSETIPGAYTLCLLVDNHVHQYRILPDSDGKLSVQSEAGVRSRKFVDLAQLIHEYKQRGQKNGLAGPLVHPVPVENLSDDENESVLGSDDDKLEEDLQFEIKAPSDDSEGCAAARGDGDKNEFNDFVYRYFLQRFTHLNLSSCDGAFNDALRHYVETGTATDAKQAAGGQKTMYELRSVFDESAKELDRCIDSLMLKIDICRQLFGPMTTTPLAKSDQDAAEKADLSSVLERMIRCKGAIQNLERKAELKYKDLNSMWKEGGVLMPESTTPSPSRGMPVKPIIPAMSFEAKVLKMGKLSKIKLTVDIQAGKLMAVKPSKDVLNDHNVFTHEKIEQLIKSSEKKSYLDVKVAGAKRTYVFEDMKQRENFCQLVQQLKNMHSLDSNDVKQVSVFIGTWNMASEIPPMSSLIDWLMSSGAGKRLNHTLSLIPHDIYVVGTQESVISDKEWAGKLRSMLFEKFGESFQVVSIVSLWSIRMIILVKQQHKNKISLVQQSCVRTGIANTLGNKGAVGVSFSFNRTSLCFVCAHLASGCERWKKRNQNFRDIIKGLNLGPKSLGPFDSTNHFDHMFFFGDLNYRIDELNARDIVNKIGQLEPSGSYSSLLEYDQLKLTQKVKEAFVGFREEEIVFRPTYRFRKGTRDRYAWEKYKTTGLRINAPSWCDRVLWRSYPDTRIINTSYGSVEGIPSSDHKPVFSSFDVRVITQFTSSKGGSAPSGDMKVIFQEISAEVKSSKQENFQIGFYSSCLEVPVFSKQNDHFNSRKEAYCCPKWTSTVLPQLQPIFDDWDFLEDQHLLLTIKTVDGLESYGECVVALKTMLDVKPQQFSAVLTHLGEETGTVRGMMHVKARDNSTLQLQGHKSRKAYELIYMDTDFRINDDDSSSICASAEIYQDVVELSHPLSVRALASEFTKGTSGGDTARKGAQQKPTVGTRPKADDSPLLFSKCAGADAAASCGSSPECTKPRATAATPTPPFPTAEANRYSEWPTRTRSLSSAAESAAALPEKSDKSDLYEDVHAPSVPPRKRGMATTADARAGGLTGTPPHVKPVTSRAVGTPPLAQIRQILSKTDAKTAAAVGLAENAAGSGVLAAESAKERNPSAADEVDASECIYQAARHQAIIPDEEWKVPEAKEKCDAGQTYDCPGCFSSAAAGAGVRDVVGGEGKLNGFAAGGSVAGAGADAGLYDTPAATVTNRQLLANPSVLSSSYVTQSSHTGSIDQWLAGLGLIQYRATFLENGWDNVDFLTDMTAQDVELLNISSTEHQAAILSSIDAMNRRKAT